MIAAAADFYPTGITADTQPCEKNIRISFMCVHFQRIISPLVAKTLGNNLKISTEITVIDPNWHRVMLIQEHSKGPSSISVYAFLDNGTFLFNVASVHHHSGV